MMVGARIVINPIKKLKFELINISQWGGKEYDRSLSGLLPALITDTNNGNNSHINRVAGIGISYSTNYKTYQTNLYGQLLGEDEAGNLPYCFIYLAGFEVTQPYSKYYKKFGFEVTDTRTSLSSAGNCGPNSAYNNQIYDYTNHGKVLGVPIDTGSKSAAVWASAKLSPTLTINYQLKILVNK